MARPTIELVVDISAVAYVAALGRVKIAAQEVRDSYAAIGPNDCGDCGALGLGFDTLGEAIDEANGHGSETANAPRVQD